MADAHKNFAYSTVATAPSPASSGTSLTVQTGDGALFPAVSFNATVWPAGANPLASNAEIVRVTAVSTDTFTITRTQESTSARSIVVGDQIAATITAKTLTDAEGAGASGTSFPGSPTTNDRFYRTDRALEYYYDGTRWLTTQLFETSYYTVTDASVSTSFGRIPPLAGAFDLWMVDARVTYNVPSNHTVSNYWTIAPTKYDNTTSTALCTITTDKSTTTWNNPAPTAIGALLGTTQVLIFISLTKVGTPGNLAMGIALRYRIVG